MNPEYSWNYIISAHERIGVERLFCRWWKRPINCNLVLLSYDNKGFLPKLPVFISMIYHFLINLVAIP